MARREDRVLEAYRGLRVVDVSDGMDAVGRASVGLMDGAIGPIWPGVRAYGRAVTARYVATNEVSWPASPEEYADYVGRWYAERCQFAFLDILVPGDFLVVDMSDLEVGLWDSNVGLAAVAKGVHGVVLNGGCRDVEEMARQRCAVWARHRARTSVVGRLEFESLNQMVNCGGVKVVPGDVVVADENGVIVVPQEVAPEVAHWARQGLEADKRSRRAMYESLGRPVDETVE